MNCKVDTKTSTTTNLNGTRAASSDRTQLFNNGAPIDATIKKGVTVSGSGLYLFEGDRAGLPPRPITVSNEGEVTANDPFGALEIAGNGGAITYTGNGGVANSNRIGVGLSVADQGGPVSITTGAGAIKGATGILASDAYAGALTITTGSGLVSGSAGPGISATTASGAINIAIGSGGAAGHGAKSSAVAATSTNGDISITASGYVAGYGDKSMKGDLINYVGGVQRDVEREGRHHGGRFGDVLGQYGRGIWAKQGARGLGGILITGSGATLEGSASLRLLFGDPRRDRQPGRLEQRYREPLRQRDRDQHTNPAGEAGLRGHPCADGRRRRYRRGGRRRPDDFQHRPFRDRRRGVRQSQLRKHQRIDRRARHAHRRRQRNFRSQFGFRDLGRRRQHNRGDQ